MNKIRGTANDHKEFIKWAKKRNEKLLDFVADQNGNAKDDEQRVILALPDKIDKWLMYNCFLDFIKDHYRGLHGPDYWKYEE
jgi:hypothetical protein